MISTWKQSIEKIKGAIDLSNSASYKIAIAANQQEKIAIQEASSISEITTTVEELNNSSKQVSENADMVAEGSKDVLKIAFDGQDSVNKSIEEFNAIRERVNMIAETMVTINDGMKETAVAAKKTLEESGHLQIFSHQLQGMINSYKI